MRHLFLASVVGICATCATIAQTPDAQPVNPDATPAARALLHDLDTISGHATISGQHNYPNTVSRYSDRVYDFGVPGAFCTSCNERNWYERSLEWHEGRSTRRSRS